MAELHGTHIRVQGIVQGVGFRPFVYNLATRLALTGWVRNTSSGVDIYLDGSSANLSEFITALELEAPPLSRIHSIEVRERPTDGYQDFKIIKSESDPAAFQPISPDVAVCPDCLEEMFDPTDRRYRYPFINCTNCGPRYTIIRDIPYDRPLTTMAKFRMCEACQEEYLDPQDRRFHAQPVACPECGPKVWLEVAGEPNADENSAIPLARELLRQGKTVAIKGLGGFHLACDATNPEAVSRLRHGKLRVDKPFAVMFGNLQDVEANCEMSAFERKLLVSIERPIVLVERSVESKIVKEVAPGQRTLGLMLPYTPLHHLLLEASPDFPEALVMTSGNLSEEPIATDNSEARERLIELADAFLMHDRGIHIRCDDSVVRTFQDRISPIRRSRGYVPFPVQIPWASAPILAVGAELKNTFCLTRDRYAFVSHHIGDMENFETSTAFEQGIQHFQQLFHVQPEFIAYDLHPDYLATRYALERANQEGIPAFGVQHHHAHIAACLADNGVQADEPVIGVSFDGTGYGTDGTIWGGEILLAKYSGFERLFHLRYCPLPGGDQAIREPWRMALAWLRELGLEAEVDRFPLIDWNAEKVHVVAWQLEKRVNAPDTSSMGRLFDAVASLVGVRQEVNYEAQAAIELEALVDVEVDTAYPFSIEDGIIDPGPMFLALMDDITAEIPIGVISARFHRGLAHLVLQVCEILRGERGINQVALSGGVWQNMHLLEQSVKLLEASGFQVHLHQQVPANDGGICLGQAAIALHQLNLGT